METRFLEEYCSAKKNLDREGMYWNTEEEW